MTISSVSRALTLALAWLPFALTAQSSSPRVGNATVTTTAPIIDGRLTDDAWRSATVLTGFTQREPHEGAPISERTEVRLMTDGEALYIGAWLYDREATGIVDGEKIRDVTLTNSDYFGILLDTYRDRQNGFLFATTPAGVEYDGQIIREGEGGGVTMTGQNRAQAGALGGFNLNWDGSWTVMTSRDSAGWYAEFRIPFSTLRYGAGQTQAWGLNLVRMIRRRNEEAFWAPIPRQFNLYRLSLAGDLTGLQVPARRVATVTPSVLSAVNRNFALRDNAVTTGQLGVDVKYGVTPSLTLDLTVNTDFAQVEVDEQRTNLTRFPLFFPEKRPFFLENAGVFAAGTPQAADLFFTRRIGIDSMGQPVKIRGGGRLTGRVGGMTVGLLQIFTGENAGVQDAQSFSVARAIKEVGRRSRIGVIGVQRLGLGTRDALYCASPTQCGSRPDDVNRTYGVDGRLGLGDAWTVDAWAARTETPRRDGDDAAGSARVVYLTRDWSANARVMRVGGDFNPEVGFLARTPGYTFTEVQVMRMIRRDGWKHVREWNPHMTYREYYGLDGFHQSGQWHLDFTEVSFQNGGRFGPEVNLYHEGLQKPFTIAPGVTLPVGSYDFVNLGLDWETNAAAPLSFTMRGDFAGFYNGTRSGGTMTLTYRRGASITSSLLLDYNDVTLDQGHFVKSIIGARIAYFFTPRVFVQTLAQFNDQASAWTTNVRFGWLNTAATGLFVVLNDGEQADRFFNWQRPLARSLTVKFTRQFGTGG
ncbi:MAG: carbohydrate binding family 9 domain-containing protein [Gemmatimonadaceae bacterium]|nr:carbohydrate binding family 9 domain-containing protein [Gemmatimonadaceae bacterium]